MKKILIVEDDNAINEMITVALVKEGYDTVSAYSGTEAILRVETDCFHLIILDLMLPGMRGEEVLTQIRKKKNVPIIILSALDGIDDKVKLLSLGANDYMTKPFDLKELLARIMVQLRQNQGNDGTITFGELMLDNENKEICVNGNPIVLTAQEFKIMALLMSNPKKVYSKNEIYEYAWDDYYIGDDKTVNVHISNIRRKIKKYTDHDYIETLWGLGFRLKEKLLSA